MTLDWFKIWFNSKYYFLLYQNRNEEEAEKFFELIKNNLNITSDWKILDFCCGYGRLSKVISASGFDVTGIDLSDYFIEKAIKDSREKNLNIKFIKCDARTFNEFGKYNLVISFFTSFGYFTDEENEITFQNLCKSVIQKGWIVFDYFNPDFVINNLDGAEEILIDHIKFKISRKIENNRVKKLIEVFTEDNKEEYVESVRIYSYNDLNDLFVKNGFVVEKVFGDYSGSEYSALSPRIIIFAQKI